MAILLSCAHHAPTPPIVAERPPPSALAGDWKLGCHVDPLFGRIAIHVASFRSPDLEVWCAAPAGTDECRILDARTRQVLPVLKADRDEGCFD
ncbi:MAG: hypothetical protein KC621_02315 [Myxococcales bacterium]|nr:hypothetical protein [Myxococcales bacterium]